MEADSEDDVLSSTVVWRAFKEGSCTATYL